MSIGNSDKKPSNSAFDERQRDGQEPLEEVGPGECQVEAEKCQIQPGELEGQPGACQIDHDEEIQDAFPVEEIPIIMDPEDGMPRPDDMNQDLPFAHPFTYDTVNCIEDDRVYVEVFEEELQPMGELAYLNTWMRLNQVRVRKSYRWDHSMPNTPPTFVERRSVDASKVKKIDRYMVCAAVDLDPDAALAEQHKEPFVLVRPIRPRCKYYKRQKFAHDGIAKGEFGHFLLFRNCTMRRSVGGAFMSLMNEAVYACDYRDPPDPVSIEKYLDKQDRKTLTERPDLTLVPMFGQEGDDVRLKEKK